MISIRSFVLSTLSGLVLSSTLASAQNAPTLGKTSYEDAAMRGSGDAGRGSVVFQLADRVGCVRCHSVDGSSSLAGPDLFAIGDKFPRRELIRAVLHPSDAIAVGYGTTVVETQDGEEHSGVVKQATADFIELVGADGKHLRLATADIRSQTTSSTSLMPDGLEAGMTPAEFADLIAYLETLRQPLSGGNSAVTRTEIPSCAKPAKFIPFFDAKIQFNHPVWFGEVPDAPNTFIVLEHAGRAWLLERGRDGDTQASLLDLRGVVREGGATGLLGLAFHPRFSESHRYYLKYHVVENGRIFTLIMERELAGMPLPDKGTSREILRVDAVTQDHNGGSIEFGPDGFLYIGTGDTGPQRDPQGHGQDLGTLQAKMLRIDVDHPTDSHAYGIPQDNPFRDRAGARPEIWAYGFREPWRFSFDPLTGDLWVGDVGQDRFEEVGIVRAGENHGWNVIEGETPFSEQYRREGERYVAPVLSYPHRIGVSVTGGYVYRGVRAPALRGRYVFADFESRRVWALTQTNRMLRSVVEIGRAPSRVVSFAQDHRGELYTVGYDSGQVYALDLAGVDPTALQARTLAATAETQTNVWRFTESRPAEGWSQTSFDASGWKQGAGGFGTRGTPGAIIGTEWRGADIWLRREITLPDDIAKRRPGSVALRVHHDEDTEVFLNSVSIAQLGRWTWGYIDVPLTAEAITALRPGTNLLAIHCHQNSGGQYIDAGFVEYVLEKTGN
jgi:putative heme-binding domain-containing protein